MRALYGMPLTSLQFRMKWYSRSNIDKELHTVTLACPSLPQKKSIKKFNLLEFLKRFCDFVSCYVTCVRVATRATFLALCQCGSLSKSNNRWVVTDWLKHKLLFPTPNYLFDLVSFFF